MIKLCETCRFGFRNTLSGKSECPLTCCCRSDWKDAMGSCSWTNEPRIKDVKTPEPEPEKPQTLEDVYNERKELVDKYCATDISKYFDKVLFELYPLKKKRLCKRLTLNGFYTPLLRARKESWKFSFKKWKAVEEYMRYVITYYDEVIDIIERRKETELQRKAEKLQRKETKELIKVIGKRCKCGAKRRGKFCAKCGNTL